MRMDNGLLIRARTTKIITNRYESHLTTFVIDNVVPGGIMVDVGASVGIYALQVAPRFSHIICVEPSASEARLLHQNLHLNWGADGMPEFEIHRVAAGESDDPLVLFTSDQSKFVPEIDTGQFSEAEIETRGLKRTSVPCQRLDSLVDGRKPVQFIKIDVEGFEPSVLRGARDTIQANQTILVQVEGMGDRSALLQQLRDVGLTALSSAPPYRPIEDLAQLDGVRDFFAVGPAHPLVANKS